MSSADTKAHKTGPARLLTDEDVSALEAFDEGYEAYFGKMIDYLDKFVERGVRTLYRAAGSGRPGAFPVVRLCLQQS